MKWTKKILYVLGVLLGTLFALTLILNIIGYAYSMVAGPFERRPDGLIWNPPACIDQSGRKVRIVFPPHAEFSKRARALGTVITHPVTGEALIALDGEYFKQMPPELQRFIVHHECGHINLGHLRWIIHEDPLSLEKEAECYAMQAARREGWSSERFTALYAAMVNRELLRPVFEGMKYDEYMARAHAWSPEERVEWARSCPLP